MASKKQSIMVEIDADFSKLHIAASKGNLGSVKALLRCGTNVNIEGTKKITPLHIAAQEGHLEVVKLLVEHGASLTSMTEERCSPLHMALQHRQREVSEFLIEKGSDLNVRDSHDWTPLHDVCFNGLSLGIVKELLKRGSDINARNDTGRTPLHLAAELNYVEIVQCLIENGAEIDALDNTTWTPLHRPIIEGHLKVTEMLLENGANPKYRDEPGWTPLHFAAQSGHVATLKLLLKYGVDVNAKSAVNATPLHLAAQFQQPRIVDILLEHGCEVNVKVNELAPHRLEQLGKNSRPPPGVMWPVCFPNATPLHLAAMAGNAQILKALLNAGAYFDAEAPAGACSYPIDFAKINGNVEAIKLLELVGELFQDIMFDDMDKIRNHIKEGALVNARDKSGRSALYYASGTGSYSAVDTLLQNNADVAQASKGGITALYKAAHKGHVMIVKLLLKHAVKTLNPTQLHCFVNAKINVEIPEDAWAKKVATMKKKMNDYVKEDGFLKISNFHAFNPGKTTAKDSTALHTAARKNNLKVVKLLLKHGALYNFKNKDHKAPSDLTTNQEMSNLFQSAKDLFEAVKTGNEEKVNQLLPKYECVVNVRDSAGEATPLYWAVHNGHLGVVKLLLKNGADPTFVTNKGNTPLHIAASKGNSQAAQLLLEHLKSNSNKSNLFLNAQTAVGRTTALHIASSVDVAKTLLQYGAIYDIKNKDGKTPLDLAKGDVKNLLVLMDKLFEGAKNGDVGVMSEVKVLKIDELKAVTCARNEQDQHTALQVSLTNSSKFQALTKKLSSGVTKLN